MPGARVREIVIGSFAATSGFHGKGRRSGSLGGIDSTEGEGIGSQVVRSMN
jgi:hypothetical protein